MSELTIRKIFTYQDSIYLLSNAATWEDAQAEAESFGGNLVTINDGTEQTFLAGLFAGQNLWTGYSDASVEGDFEWADGDSSTYTHWAAGQPNDFRGEDFVILDSNGSWNDVRGTAQIQGIIEIKNPTTPILVVSDLSIIEPSAGTKEAVFSVRRYGDSNQQTTVNYDTADDTAIAGTNYTATSGTLTFNPGETAKTISVTINSDADVTSGETFLLNLNAPTNAILGDNQAKATIRETTDAITFGNSTYVLTNPGTWGEAQEQAKALGGNLVTINSAEEQTFLAGAYAGQNSWIGYSDAGQEYDATTGDGFEWVNGTSAYTHWGTGQPNDFRGEDFVILDSNGNWNDVAGTGNFRGIVEIPGALPQPIPDLTTKQIYTHGDSIYFLSEANNWGMAQSEAQAFQGNLVTINDGTEQTFLAGLFAGQNLWTGYSDAGVEGDFQWIDGDDSTYSQWAAGHPNNFREEDFVILGSNGNWNDVKGTGNFQGVVEIKNPETPILVIENLSIVEPANGTKQAVFSVRRYGNSTASASVRYSTADDTAIAGTNYIATSGTLSFAPGETEKTISVAINADTDAVSGETFFLNLDTPTNTLLGRNQATATIREGSETVTFGDSTYLLTNPGNWGEAQEQARTFGGNLVTINSGEEQAFLAEAYAGENLWIGYSDAGKEYDPTTEDGFEWISGTSAYTNWQPGHPNNFREEDFVILGSNGNWNDVNGTGNFRGIIEIPGTPIPSASGEIRGTKWNDLNANGIRDTALIGGDKPDIAFVLDVSGSTEKPFAGSSVGDLNGDGLANTRLDAEIAGFITLNDQLVKQGLSDKVDVSIITYGTSAANADMNLVADDLQLSTAPGADVDGNGITDVEDILRSIRVGAFGTGTYTNPEAALRQVEETFDSLGTADGDGNVVVLTDGEQNRGGSIVNEVERLLDRNVNLKSFGVGNDASLNVIQTIDPDGVKFTSTDELLDTFNDLSGGGDSFLEPGLAGVAIYLDQNNNGILDRGESIQITAMDDPNTLDIDETGQYSFTDLAPGTYVVREIVPTGFEQTFPNIDASQNLITNGSFEKVSPFPTSDPFLIGEAGSTTIEGWTITGESIDYHSSGDLAIPAGNNWEATDGKISIDLNGSPGKGGLAQTFNTVPGTTYRLSFDLSGNPLGGPAIRELDVVAAGQSAQFEFDITGNTSSDMGWQTETWEFTAVDTTTTLEFNSKTESDFFGPAIDNVRVNFATSGFHVVNLKPDEIAENINFGNAQDSTNLDINLLVNPDAESSPGASDFNQVLTPFGWETSNSAFTAVKYSAAVPGQDLDTADGTAVNGDTNYFSGGPSNPFSTATQVIGFYGIEEQIDGGLLSANLSGFFGGWVRQEDNMIVEATFYDENQTILESFEIGSISAADRGGESKLLFQEDSLLVPVGARSAEVEMVATRQQGSYNDGYADNLSFVLSLNDGVQPVNRVEGTDGRDTLTGTTGDDIIIGKGGSDRLTGNAGADQFVFQSIDDRIDRINDFEVGADTIVLSDLLDSLGVSIDSYDQAIEQGYLGITSFGRDNSRIRIDTNGMDGNGGARTLAIAYDVTPTELGSADNFVI